MPKSLVVFHDHGNHVLDPLLKTGFKHVFCCVNDGDYWISIDGKAGLPDVNVVAKADYDLKSFYENEGFTVVEVDRGKPVRVPLVLSNCVGSTKAVLGIRGLSVTPYQLYKRLK